MSTDYSSLMVHEMWHWIEERAAAGQQYAKAVSAVRFEDGVLTLEFDPVGKAGYTEEAFYSLDQIPNLAGSMGSWLGPSDELGEWMRENVTRLCAVKVDGAVIQCVTGDELHRWATEG